MLREERARGAPARSTAELARDLEAIALKALEKERARRYASRRRRWPPTSPLPGADEPVLAAPAERDLPAAGSSRDATGWRARRSPRSVARLARQRPRSACTTPGAPGRPSAWRRAASRTCAGWRARCSTSCTTRSCTCPARHKRGDDLAATALEYLDALEREAGDDTQLLEELAEGRLRLGEVLGAPGNVEPRRPRRRRARARARAGGERALAVAREPDAAARAAARARAAGAVRLRARVGASRARAWSWSRSAAPRRLWSSKSDPRAADRRAAPADALSSEQAEILELLGRSDEALALQQARRRRACALCASAGRTRWSCGATRPSCDDGSRRPAPAARARRRGPAGARRRRSTAPRAPAPGPGGRRGPQERSRLVLTWRGSALMPTWRRASRAALEDFQGAIELHRELLHRDPHELDRHGRPGLHLPAPGERAHGGARLRRRPGGLRGGSRALATPPRAGPRGLRRARGGRARRDARSPRPWPPCSARRRPAPRALEASRCCAPSSPSIPAPSRSCGTSQRPSRGPGDDGPRRRARSTRRSSATPRPPSASRAPPSGTPRTPGRGAW